MAPPSTVSRRRGGIPATGIPEINRLREQFRTSQNPLIFRLEHTLDLKKAFNHLTPKHLIGRK